MPPRLTHGIATAFSASRMRLLALVKVLQRQERGERGEEGDGQRPRRGVLDGDAADHAAEPEEDSSRYADSIRSVHKLCCRVCRRQYFPCHGACWRAQVQTPCQFGLPSPQNGLHFEPEEAGARPSNTE